MNKAAFYALMAALLNAFVGVFNLGAFGQGISPHSVAFYKCLTAFVILTVCIAFMPAQRKACRKLFSHYFHIALIAFCGIFLLFYFETKAYRFNTISVVAFTVLGVSTLTTFIGSTLILKKNHPLQAWLGMLLAVIGLVFFHFSNNTQIEMNLGFFFAAIAGVGYGLFLVLNKKNPADFHGVAMLWWLLLFGCLYLLIPFCQSPLEIPSIQSCFYILLLGLGSTIGGFYFTTKALSIANATTVQLFELNEPLFASLLGFIFYKQWLSLTDILGGTCILFAIYISNKNTSKDANSIIVPITNI